MTAGQVVPSFKLIGVPDICRPTNPPVSNAANRSGDNLPLVYTLSVATAADAQFVGAEEPQQRIDDARQLLAKEDAHSIAWRRGLACSSKHSSALAT
jgi:hypothetical protein